MLCKRHNYLAFNRILWLGIIAIVFILLPNTYAAELSTLFTTPQERQIINANRYKSEIVSQSPARPVESVEPEQMTEPVKEEVKKAFLISGITISNEGQHSVWINGQVYQDGERIEGKSKVRVMVDKKIRVRITAPDGRHYFGTSGETVEISYLEASDF